MTAGGTRGYISHIWEHLRHVVVAQIVVTLNTELTHPTAQGIGMEIKDLGSTFWPFNDPVGLLEGFENMLALNFF